MIPFPFKILTDWTRPDFIYIFTVTTREKKFEKYFE